MASPTKANILKDASSAACGKCHSRNASLAIEFSGGFIRHHEQYEELLASGGHAGQGCVACHDPHGSAHYDPANAITTSCSNAACHMVGGTGSKPMAMPATHVGKTFYLRVGGNVVHQETLSCESCHMPYASKSAVAAGATAAGTSPWGGRTG